MKFTTRDYVSGRTRDGRVYSAMQGTESIIDDGDADMVALVEAFAAAGQVDIHKEAEPEPEPAADEEVAADWYQSRTVAELRDLARERGLQVSGSKDELVARLMEDAE